MKHAVVVRRHPPRGSSLAEWLNWLETLHPASIELGLERVRRVAARAGLASCPLPLVIVGGTNGKGSTVERLGRVYRAAGYHTGTYFSPHIERFNERIRIDGLDADDQCIIAAFEAIVPALGDDTLTYFEFTTLAAMRLFLDDRVEVIILEVGLGGRLDATNLWHADCAIVTSIALDHQDWLGNSRELIGREKVGIGRTGKPLIVGDPAPPESLLQYAQEQGMHVIRPVPDVDQRPLHVRRNIACVRAAVSALSARLPVEDDALSAGTGSLMLSGRFERLLVQGQMVYLDVLHNPAAAEALLETLDYRLPGRRLHLILAMLADKDAFGVARVLAPRVDAWYCTTPGSARGMPPAVLSAAVQSVPDLPENRVRSVDSIGAAWWDAHQALSAEGGTAGILFVAGSFHTVAAMHEFWRSEGLDVSRRPFDE